MGKGPNACLRCAKPLTKVQQWNRTKYCSEDCSNKYKQESRKARLEDEAVQVWACGGGVQSTAIAALICAEKISRPALAWIVDVGWERSATWEYVNGFLVQELAKHGVTLNTIKTTDYRDNHIVDDSNFVRLPAYRINEQGSKCRFNTRCSEMWKRRTANDWLKSQGVERCDTWLGISVDEIRRARKSQTWWNQNRYPLVELGIDRGKCQWLIGKMGWPAAPRTSCYFCPGQSDAAWIQLKRRYPDEFQKACEIEMELGKIKPGTYLHEFCRPLSEIVFRNEDKLQMECFGSDENCWSG